MRFSAGDFVRKLLGRERSKLPPYDFARSPYRMKKQWPPDMKKVSHFKQFQWERRFKRRMLIKSIRPQWQRGVKILTWSVVSAITIYTVFFYDHRNDAWNANPGEEPYQWIRDWTKDFLRGIFGDFWSTTATALEEARERPGRRDDQTSTERAESFWNRKVYPNQTPPPRLPIADFTRQDPKN
jgi:hypothetical protein